MQEQANTKKAELTFLLKTPYQLKYNVKVMIAHIDWKKASQR